MSSRVAGKCALVTGAAQGQRAAHAELLGREGARVVATDVRNAAGAGLAERLAGGGLDIVYRHGLVPIGRSGGLRGLVHDEHARPVRRRPVEHAPAADAGRRGPRPFRGHEFPGLRIAFESGSGKSTVLVDLPRFADPVAAAAPDLDAGTLVPRPARNGVSS